YAKVVFEPASNSQSVNARLPFVMITGDQERLLIFARSEAGVCGIWIVARDNVACFCFAINRPHVNAVFGGELLLELKGKLGLQQIVVRPLARISAMKQRNGIAAVAKGAVLRGRFG